MSENRNEILTSVEKKGLVLQMGEYTIEERIVRTHAHLIETKELFYLYQKMFENAVNMAFDIKHDKTLVFFHELLVIKICVLIDGSWRFAKDPPKKRNFSEHCIETVLSKLTVKISSDRSGILIKEQIEEWEFLAKEYCYFFRNLFNLRDTSFAHLDKRPQTHPLTHRLVVDILNRCENILLKIDKEYTHQDLLPFNETEYQELIDNT